VTTAPLANRVAAPFAAIARYFVSFVATVAHVLVPGMSIVFMCTARTAVDLAICIAQIKPGIGRVSTERVFVKRSLIESGRAGNKATKAHPTCVWRRLPPRVPSDRPMIEACGSEVCEGVH